MTKKRILIIDDEIDFIEVLQRSLVKEGCEVVYALNGSHAKALFESGEFDAVFSDFYMPNDVSGINLLLDFEKIRPVPFVLMTGYTDVINLDDASELGATLFLIKPFTTKNLHDVLHSIFGEEK